MSRQPLDVWFDRQSLPRQWLFGALMIAAFLVAVMVAGRVLAYLVG